MYPAAPEVISGYRVLMIALVTLGQEDRAERLLVISAGSAFWARSSQAPELVSAGQGHLSRQHAPHDTF